MLTFLDFVLLIILVAVLMILIFLSTGIVYNQKGCVSIIKKGKQYIIEERPFSYYFPIVFRKVAYYPVAPKEYKINQKEKITLYVKDVRLLYQHKVNIKKLLKQNKNLEDTFKKYKIVIVKK